jgi:iron complex transport system substrate-binding protein
VKKVIAVFLITSMLAFSGCTTAPKNVPNGTQSRVVADSLGHDVALPQKVDRVISLAPSITEMIYAAGGGKSLVGVTTYCNYPPEALTVQKVSDTQTPNIEAIVALKPQVVFVSTDSQLQSFADLLAQQNIAVFVSDVKRFDDVPKFLRTLGNIFGTVDSAERSAADIERRAGAISERVRNAELVRTFVQISREPFFTIGRDSFLSELIQRAGGVSVTKDIPSAYPKLSKETALALKPDVIILSDSEDNREPNDVFNDSPAVRNRRMYRINADIISRPGPRLVDALENIAGFLHDTAER